MSIGARRSPETEEAILDAAEALILEGGGYKALTMDAVARRARAGKATLYKWWPSRARLLLALYARRKAQLPLEDTGSLGGDLIAFYRNLFRFWQRTPVGNLFRYVVAEAQLDPDVMAVMTAYAGERRADTEELFERAAKRGDLRPGVSPAVAADLIVSVAWNRLLTERLDDEAGMIAAVTLLLAGFAPS